MINRAEPTLKQEVLEEVAPAGDPFTLDPATEKKNTRAKKKKSSEEETQKATEEVERERKETEHQPKLNYQRPPLSLLKRGKAGGGGFRCTFA